MSLRARITALVRDPLNLIIKDNIEKIFELLEVRKEIETWSVYYAAQRASGEDIERLSRIIEEMEAYSRKQKIPPTKLDADFHLAIAQCSYNTIQAHLTFTIYDIFKDYFNFLIENICFNRKYLQAIYSQHLAIYNAIRQRKSEEARNRIMEHLTFVDAELKRETERTADETTR